MGAIPLAFARQIWWRHRWGLECSALVVLVLAIVCPPLHDWIARAWSVPVRTLAVPLVGVPAFAVTMYLLSVFMLAEGPLGDMSAGYSRRMFTLPVRTAALVAWPMILGAAALSVLWLALALLVVRRCGVDMPTALPALGLIALLAWLQALTWTPHRFNWLGIFGAAAIVVGQIGAVVWMVVVRHAPPWILVLAGVGSIAAAYAVAVIGVAKDRRGDGRDEPGWWVWIGEAAARRWKTRAPYRSAASAQLAFEFRNNGLPLPIFAAIFLATIAPALVLGRKIEYDLVRGLLAVYLVMPAIMAGPLGAHLARSSPFFSPRSTCFPFIATRPMTNGMLVAAKFRSAMLSVLAALAITILGLTLTLLAAGYREDLARMARDLQGFAPGPRAIGAVLLALMLAVVLTWRQFTSGLAAGLTGRKYLTDLGALGFFGLVTAVFFGGLFLSSHPRYVPYATAAVPWGLGVSVLAKLAGSSWAFREAVRRGFMTAREAARDVLIWSAVVATLIGLSVWVLPAKALPVAAPAVWLAMAAAVPLGRIAMSPLALDWDRHR